LKKNSTEANKRTDSEFFERIMCEDSMRSSHPRKPQQMNLRKHRPANGSYPFSSFTHVLYLWSCQAIAADAKKADEEDDKVMALVPAEVLLYMLFQTGHISSINFMPMSFLFIGNRKFRFLLGWRACTVARHPVYSRMVQIAAGSWPFTSSFAAGMWVNDEPHCDIS
jgi:hypothetical protein